MKLKKTWINFLIIGINFILIAFSSCIGRIDYIKEVDYIYKNRTGVDLVMEVYNLKDKKRLIKSFEIKNGEEVKTNTTDMEVPALFSFIDSYGGQGDSIVVKFTNKKCLYWDQTNSNIFTIEKYDNYSEELLEKSKYTLYYTFTEADYKASVDCK